MMGLFWSYFESPPECPPPTDQIGNCQADLEEVASAYVRKQTFSSMASRYEIGAALATADHSIDSPQAEQIPLPDSYYSDDHEKEDPGDPYEDGTPMDSEEDDDQYWDENSWQKGGVLGTGSFGTVFLGLNLHNGELVAVKEILLSEDMADHADIRLLQQEIAHLKTLKHENIVGYLGSSVTGNYLHIFLEYVSGGSIASILRRFGKMNEKLISIYTKQILQGLNYMHRRQIIHRDIKGANILLDNKGVIKLADFGASKKLEGLVSLQNGSGCKSLTGTVYWMAPEVIKQSGYGRQADIWSLGCTVIEMATAAPPWSGEYKDQVSALFNIAINNTHPTLPDSLSEGAKDFLLHCLKRDPMKRLNAANLMKHPFISNCTSPSAAPNNPWK